MSFAVVPGLSGENVAFGGKSSSWETFAEVSSKAFPSASAKPNLNCCVASLFMSDIIKGVKVKGRSCLRNDGRDQKGQDKLEMCLNSRPHVKHFIRKYSSLKPNPGTARVNMKVSTWREGESHAMRKSFWDKWRSPFVWLLSASRGSSVLVSLTSTVERLLLGCMWHGVTFWLSLKRWSNTLASKCQRPFGYVVCQCPVILVRERLDTRSHNFIMLEGDFSVRMPLILLLLSRWPLPMYGY